MGQAKSIRYKEIATALFVLFLSASVAIAAELLLRFDWWNRGGVAVLTPDTVYNNSRRGEQTEIPEEPIFPFRGPGTSIPKPQGVVRIAFLGGSSTRDVYAADDKSTWTYQAWVTLQTLLPKCHFDYVNAGQNGYGIDAMHKLYDNKVSSLDPDVVVFSAIDLVNDLARTINPQSEAKPSSVKWAFLRQYSLLWRHIESTTPRIRRLRNAKIDQKDIVYPPADVLSRNFESRLGALVDTIKKDGRVPALVPIPRMMRPDQGVDVRKRAARRLLLDIPYINLDKYFEYRGMYRTIVLRMAENTGAVLMDAPNLIPAEDKYYVDSYHLTPSGSTKFGRFIGTELANSSVIRSQIRTVSSTCIE